MRVNLRGERTVSAWSVALAIGVAASLVFVAVQRGHDIDEAEHAHAAWLIGAAQLAPLSDFFQHHQPVLWDSLKLYFWMGGTGPEVVYFGRGLVVVCVAIVLGSCVYLASRWGHLRSDGVPGGLSGITVILSMIALLPEVLVIRPETLSAALFCVSLVSWDSGCGSGRGKAAGGDLIAGALYGLAVFASPRFLPMGALFLLVHGDSKAALDFRPARLARLAVGAGASVAAYTVLLGYPIRETWFNLVFSARLQRLGPGNRLDLGRDLAVGAIVALILATLWLSVPRGLRKRVATQAVFLLFLLAGAVWAAGRYLYPQNFLTIVLAAAVVAVYAEAHIAWSDRVMTRRVLLAGFACLGGVILWRNVELLQGKPSIFELNAGRNKVLEMVPPGDTVIVGANLHPIAARDASYYGPPMLDGPDRVCEAVRAMEAEWRLPPCSYLQAVVENAPALVDPVLLSAVPAQDREPLIRAVAARYTRVPPGLFLRRGAQ